MSISSDVYFYRCLDRSIYTCLFPNLLVEQQAGIVDETRQSVAERKAQRSEERGQRQSVEPPRGGLVAYGEDLVV